jgi:hypothetical protein
MARSASRDELQRAVPEGQTASLAEQAVGITAKEAAASIVSGAVGAAVSMVATPLAGAAAALVTGAAIRVGSELGGQMMDAASVAASDAGEAVLSAFGLSTTDHLTQSADKAIPKESTPTAIGAATLEHVVDPTSVALDTSAHVLESTRGAVRGAGTIVAPAATTQSPEAQTAAAAIVKTSENTNIGMAAHKAVKVDSKAPDVFEKIKALLLDKNKTNADKLKEIGEIGGIGDIDDSSFKAFLGIAQAALGMTESKDGNGKTSKDASSFLGNLSENFSKIFTPEAGKSREGGAEEMNASFAACGEAMQVGIGTLPAMQSAVEEKFKSGFAEATKAAEEARKEEEAKKAREPQAAQTGAPAADNATKEKDNATKEKLSLKEVGKDSLKIAGSIALSLLVPGGFLIAMAACYILRDKAPEKEEGMPDIDASLPLKKRTVVTSPVVAATAQPPADVAAPAAPTAVVSETTPTTPATSTAVVSGVPDPYFTALPPPKVAFQPTPRASQLPVPKAREGQAPAPAVTDQSEILKDKGITWTVNPMMTAAEEAMEAIDKNAIGALGDVVEAGKNGSVAVTPTTLGGGQSMVGGR